MVALRRTLIASGVAFAVVFVLLAGQLWLGNDPALGRAGGAPAAQEREQERELHASVLDTVLGVATSLLDEEHGDEDDEQGQAVRSGTS
jgi:hypothetical protein